ncbi:MAG: hypothetical protein ACRDP3_09725 [Streptomyces sp.]|uniref:hypothetical protein n=1 Tax=Streptomyces sp. TaxID=1931 RepID=UPI003D6A59C4
MHRLRAAAMTEPGRLRGIGALLALLIVLFGAVTAWQFADRTSAADAVVENSQPLSVDAASIYRSLADADTAASSGFLAGGDQPRSMRERYERNISEASRLLASAAANSKGSASAQKQIIKLNQGLPRYTALVESARANNRQGLPLGGAYLRHANEEMRGELLPAAKKLYTAQTARLGEDYADAQAWPWFAIAAGLLALGGLGWAQRRNYHRTNRVFNLGLLGATAAALVALMWLTGAHAMARSALNESDEKGAQSLRVLNEAWIGSLQARGDENMTLVARGGGSAYEESYRKQMGQVAGADGGGASDSGSLAHAFDLADDRAGRQPVREAMNAVEQWRQRHEAAREKDDGGDYSTAVGMVIGGKGSGSTGEAFDEVDAGLAKASAHEQSEFERKADFGLSALSTVAIGGAVLALLGAVAAVLGIGRRLSEYR